MDTAVEEALTLRNKEFAIASILVGLDDVLIIKLSGLTFEEVQILRGQIAITNENRF